MNSLSKSNPVDLELKLSDGELYQCIMCRETFEYKYAFLLDHESGVKRDMPTMLQLPICPQCRTVEVNSCLEYINSELRSHLSVIDKKRRMSKDN